MMRYKIHLSVLAFIAMSIGAGCGQKGPLYLPSQPEANVQQEQAKKCQTQRCQENSTNQGQPTSQ
ncbi:MAG: lipoprotein [Pseudomonadales bacterium]|nr:lipoprotein [Pseudomonadales bacterium]